MNILCTDDVRVHEELDDDGHKIWVVHQVTRCRPGLVIKHEGYFLSSHFCPSEKPRIIYNRIGKLLLHHAWFFASAEIQRDIKGFIQTVHAQATTEPAHNAESLRNSGPAGSCCSLLFSQYDYRYCQDVDIYEKCVNQIIDEANISITSEMKEKSRIQSPLAQCSEFGVVLAELGKDSYMRLYWKDSMNGSAANENEFEGAERAADFYPFVQRPKRALGGEVLYPFFDGTTQFEVRQRYISNSNVDILLRNWILEVELRKMEDILRASLHSFRRDVAMPSRRIETLFYNYAVKGKEIFQALFNSGLHCGGKVVAPEDFLHAPIVVNSVQYSSLADLIDEAERVLRPDDRGEGYIYGFGDCHGGNILVENTDKPLGSRKVLYIDYEFAGFHSPILDFCNPFFIDVFFDIVHPATMDHGIEAMVRFENGALEISLTGPMNDLGQAILEIKVIYLLIPLCAFLESRGMDLRNIYKQLASALFLCGVSKFDWGGSWRIFFLRMAVGVVCSRITDLKSLRNLWRSVVPEQHY